MTEKELDFAAGEVLLINKPLTWSSFQVVKKLKYRIGKKIKIGHAGTLDPLATGLLIICTGKKTKSIENYQGQEKEYTGEFTLGLTTPSLDLETAFDGEHPTDHITPELIHEATKQFIGEIDQFPPIFSALKVGGERLYKKARKGETAESAEIVSRKVNITEFEITKIDLPKVEFRVVCSKGTYIRSLARDFGQALDSGAHLSALCRTRIGAFRVEDAHDLDTFAASLEKK